ncbi:MAG: diacylglycerol kinase family protein [Cyclobacteriaceae bacterium]|nr:diacylglycerol kinase family protein [Cyclobacteriaceae bacterium]
MKKFLKSFGYALEGIRSAIREQQNLRIQLLVALGMIGLGLYFSITAVEWCVLLLCIALVLSLELMNSSIENLVDLISKERNPLAGKIKDMAAGAVLVASVVAAIIGIILFLKYIV